MFPTTLTAVEEPEQEPEGKFSDVWSDPAAVELLANTTRWRIFLAATIEPVSAKELGDRLDQPVDRVSYHMRTLAKAGLVRPVRQTRRRGATETHYRAVATLELSDEQLDAAPSLRKLFSRNQILTTASDIVRELDTGESDETFFWARGRYLVSPEQRRRLHEEMVATYRRWQELERELAADRPGPGEERVQVNVVLGLYRGEYGASRNGPMTMMRDPGETLDLIGDPDVVD